jgi:hypothetical protein
MKKRLVAAVLTLSAPLMATAQAPAEPAAAPAPAPKKEEGFKVTPYGFVHAGMYFSSGNFSPKDYAGTIALPNEGSFNVSARQSRFGFRISGKDTALTGADLAAVVEADFYGGIPATTASTGYHAGPVRLRIAKVTAGWKTPVGNLELLAGQDFTLLSAITAESIAYTANVLFGKAGNFTRRSPQFRATYSNNLGILGISVAAAAINPTDAHGDVGGIDSGYGTESSAGNRSRRPEFEGRVALSVKPAADINATVGLSGHTNQRKYQNATIEDNINVYGFSTDLEMNVPFLTVKGEYHDFKGLDDTYLGIAKGVVGTLGSPLERIATYAFWGQATLKPFPALWLSCGFGQEEVKDHDKDADPTTTTPFLTRNRMLDASAIVNAGKNWRFGVEWAKTWTDVRGADDRKAYQTVVATQLKF